MNDDERLEIRAALIRQVYLHQPVGLIANVVNSAILVFIQWKAVSHPVLLIWFGAMIAATGIKYLLILRYQHADVVPAQSPRWEALFMGGVLITGAIWGAAGILLFPPGDLARQIFTAFVLGGMVAGAVGIYSALKRAFLAFSLPALIPIAINFFSTGDAVHFTMGAMVVLFAVLMGITAERNSRTVLTSLKLGLENRNLIDYLTRAKEEADSLNVKLQSEIGERKKVAEELKRHQELLEVLIEERTADLKKANEKLKKTIIELEQATGALRYTEEKYRILVNTANEAVFILQDEVIKFLNPEFTRVTGYPAEELRSFPIFNLIHPDERELAKERYYRRMKGEEVPGEYAFRMITKRGGQRYVSVNATLTTWAGRPAILCLGRDVTEKIKLEERLQVAQKLEAIGTLAGGIAHDFNNLLMSIQGNISLLMHALTPDHPDYQMLCGIEENIQSGTRLTEQLLGFARGGKYEVRTANINDIVDKTSTMFGRTRKEIRIHRAMEDPVWTVKVDKGQIEQVFLNLYINAWQAMPEGGDLYLETANMRLDEQSAGSCGIEPGKYVKISVTDTGSGVDKDTQKKLFDPFFTTREVNRGTGLGLASAYGIIKNHGGMINVYSEVGRGTTFNIYLPASDRIVEEEEATKTKTGMAKSAGAVLLVDDEERIIRPVTRFLQLIGFDVIPAAGGEEAIRIFKEKKDSVDVVILDMIMPGLSGGKTYDALKEIDPGVKVLLSSGYSLNGEAGRILSSGCNGFIQKPFTIEQLSRKLEEILHPGPEPTRAEGDGTDIGPAPSAGPGL